MTTFFIKPQEPILKITVDKVWYMLKGHKHRKRLNWCRPTLAILTYPYEGRFFNVTYNESQSINRSINFHLSVLLVFCQPAALVIMGTTVAWTVDIAQTTKHVTTSTDGVYLVVGLVIILHSAPMVNDNFPF